jgi:hypothetical protein
MIKWIGILFMGLFLAACQQQEERPTARPYPTNPALATAEPIAQSQPAGLLAELVSPGDMPLSWPPPVPTLAPMARPAITAAQQATWQALSQSAPPDRDDIRLAMAYRGLTLPLPDTARERLTVGDNHTFNITQYNTNQKIPVETELAGMSDHAYFWFDGGPGAARPDEATLRKVGAAFDEIYETAVTIFGPISNPGAKGDSRIHIVTLSPLVLCDVTLATAETCGVAGYFNSVDLLPAAVHPNGNGREMFVMNGRWFGDDFFLNVLGHEFRHLVEHRYDPSDAGWEIEGSATLAEELLGFPANAQMRANTFLQAPDLPLHDWSGEDKTARYGQGYLFNRFLYDQLGEAVYREFSQHPADSLAALDAIAKNNRLLFDGQQLWLDWLAALAIHNHPNAPQFYQFGKAGLNTVTAERLNTLPTKLESTVNQYAADYYQLPAGKSLIINFEGSTAVSLLPVSPVSGEGMWLAQRGGASNPRLTRTVDLGELTAATLSYAAYVDLEQGFDFAYVSVSEDDGRTWQPLTASQMQGLNPQDNPAQEALAERFYTGRAQHWFQESIDLSPFAGQEIQLRFEVVTNPAVTFSGFALDNIAIPEIGFYDDAETAVAGWEAEGFVRATAAIPQQWHLQLITFPNDIPQVVDLPLNVDQTTSVALETAATEKPPILIIAASAPQTLLPAGYRLSVIRNP